MRVLAIAHPNPLYQHSNNFNHITIEARLENNKIHYKEIDNRRKISFTLSEECVKSLFLIGEATSHQPFLLRGNRDFYAILNRQRKKFQERYQQLKNKQNDTTRSVTRNK
jgi:hypothetical protein